MTELTKEEKNILSDIILNTLQDVRKYKYLMFIDKEKYSEYSSTLLSIFNKLV